MMSCPLSWALNRTSHGRKVMARRIIALLSLALLIVVLAAGVVFTAQATDQSLSTVRVAQGSPDPGDPDTGTQQVTNCLPTGSGGLNLHPQNWQYVEFAFGVDSSNWDDDLPYEIELPEPKKDFSDTCPQCRDEDYMAFRNWIKTQGWRSLDVSRPTGYGWDTFELVGTIAAEVKNDGTTEWDVFVEIYRGIGSWSEVYYYYRPAVDRTPTQTGSTQQTLTSCMVQSIDQGRCWRSPNPAEGVTIFTYHPDFSDNTPANLQTPSPDSAYVECYFYQEDPSYNIP